MKKAVFCICFTLIIGCSDGTEILPCFIEHSPNDTICIEIFEPVCGWNGVTYHNECYAIKSGVSIWIEGECIE